MTNKYFSFLLWLEHSVEPSQDTKAHSKLPTFRSHVPTSLAAAFSLIGFNDQLVQFVLHEKKVCVFLLRWSATIHGVKELTAQNSYLIHVVSFCRINTASTKDQIYPSWPFPLTGLLQVLGHLSVGRFLPVSTTRTPNRHLLYLVLTYLVLIAATFGSRHKELWQQRADVIGGLSCSCFFHHISLQSCFIFVSM